MTKHRLRESSAHVRSVCLTCSRTTQGAHPHQWACRGGLIPRVSLLAALPGSVASRSTFCDTFPLLFSWLPATSPESPQAPLQTVKCLPRLCVSAVPYLLSDNSTTQVCDIPVILRMFVGPERRGGGCRNSFRPKESQKGLFSLAGMNHLKIVFKTQIYLSVSSLQDERDIPGLES